MNNKQSKLIEIIENLKSKKFSFIFKNLKFEQNLYNKEGSQATLHLQDSYIAVTNSIPEKREIIRDYSKCVIKVDNTPVFIFDIPIDIQASNKLIDVFEESESDILDVITIQWNSSITGGFVSKRHKRKRKSNLKLSDREIVRNLGKELSKVESNVTTYRPPTHRKVPVTLLPIPVENEKKTAEIFINTFGNGSIKKFYARCFMYHLITHCGIYNQFSFLVDTVKIESKHIKKLLPVDYRIKTLIKELESNAVMHFVKKEGKFYFFQFDTKILKKHKELKLQRIRIAYPLLFEAFKPKAFNCHLKYFLLIMFGYHVRPVPQFCYKISTIVSLCNLNRTKGTKHLLQLLNRPLIWLNEIGIIKNFKEITLGDLEKNRFIKYTLKEMN